MNCAPVIEIGVLGHIVIWSLIIVGILNTIFCLTTGDWFSAIFSVIGIYPSVWFYIVVYKIIANGYNYGFVQGFVCWIAWAFAWMINSVIWGALSMKQGQATAWYYFNVILLATLMVPC